LEEGKLAMAISMKIAISITIKNFNGKFNKE
jgi:hypothetical protein